MLVLSLSESLSGYGEGGCDGSERESSRQLRLRGSGGAAGLELEPQRTRRSTKENPGNRSCGCSAVCYLFCTSFHRTGRADSSRELFTAKNFGDAHRVPFVVARCSCLVLLAAFLLCFLFSCHGSILPFHCSWNFATVFCCN